MALMVPDSTTKSMNQGEFTLYEVLRDNLPNDFYVWYESSIQGSLPYSYFTILAPDFGLLIIALCNFFYQIVEVDSHNFKIKLQQQTNQNLQI
ncbi:hypothetical protein [Microcoleus asticus]|uniref:Uncharacterized protein n=1 Tax=Microcoleus asticus IPMA8 TaxID=2563858 RepID=A0ABX2CTW1_9CYAN|nr:hypothetical protein [Microcoleus asticus]NQE33578.1 hypothetical protein [Microcoleus asticus IPMA8]